MAVTNISDQQLGKFLQIVFSDGIRNQISEDYRDWEMVERQRQGDPNGREHRFFFQRSLGAAAIQWAGVSPAGSYPSAQQISTSENTAVYKEINATIELEYNLWNRARKSPDKYAEPLAIEIQSKATAAKRRMSIDLYGDGTGVVAEVSGTPTVVAGRLLVVLQSGNDDRGSVGWGEFGDKLQIYEETGVTAQTPTVGAGTFSYFTMEDKDRAANTFTLAARDSAGTELTVTTAGTIEDSDVIYRDGQLTRSNLNTLALTEDRNTITQVMAGLEALTASNGLVVHGITMSGASKGSRFSAGGDPLDVSHIQRAMSQTKVIVGEGKYQWKQMLMAPEANDVLIESRETDRRFQTIDDNKRGLKKFAYVHGNDTLEVVTSEFVPKKRIYMIPEAKQGNKVLEYWGSDFEPVRPAGQGSEFFLRPNSSGHDRFIRSYLEAVSLLLCKHPAAICVVHNFTVE